MVSTKVNTESLMFFSIFFKRSVIGVLLANRVDVLYSCPARGQSCSYNFHRYRTLDSRANLKILIATPLGLHYKKMAEGG